MKSATGATLTLTLTLLSIATTSPLVSCATLASPVDYSLFKRSLFTDPSRLINATYDYIIVGGGLAGLVVANRLSSNPNISVAVIEAGSSGYENNNKFVIPSANLYDSSVGTQYDWQWTTTPQPGLSARSATWPRGKVLGGSSAINGLYYVRHSQVEQNTWAALIGDNEDWNWGAMLQAMKKSEVFTPPNTETVRTTGMQWDTASHGTSGPVHVSYPQQTYPQVGAFLESAENVGISRSQNPDAGQSWGAFLATCNINPTNSTRSFSRTAYLDPITYRSNLDVLTGHLVTKVIFNSTTEGDAVASGVQFASAPSSAVNTVFARKEVILSGGAVNDPQILQLSGIADSNLLANFGIDTVVDLPGVGYHLQDHLSTGLVFSPANSATMPPTRVTGNAVTDSYVNSAIAYVSGETIFGQSEWNSMLTQMRGDREANVNAYDAPEPVKLGYNATYAAQVEQVFPTQIGPIELLFALSFGGVQVQAALQHPLSRGSIRINSTNPFNPPCIDPAYLSNPVDMTILREGFKLARRLATTPPLVNFISSEIAPGSGVNTDAQWENWIRNTVGTEFHPSSTCSMLPRDQGGVVDKNLKVYGTRNLRVIDASVPPISFSAHLMSITYGLAEIGSEMVLEDYTRGMQGIEGDLNAVGGGGSSGGSGTRGVGVGALGNGGRNNTNSATTWRDGNPMIASVALSMLLGFATLV